MPWNDLRKGRFSQIGGEYLITFVSHNRAHIFRDSVAAKIFCQQIAINECKYNCLWKTWVLMPNHFHGLLRLGEGDLGKTVAHLKGLSAKRVNEYLGDGGKVWQPAYHDRALRAEEDRKNIARYIVANPLRSRLVQSVKYYPYWDSIYIDNEIM